ncbi:MAG: hypothetical protein ABS58_18015 [Mesorhizobium sp. SCN 65-20]|nr:MAG: hypothetical protein ABS58_18015 [Mesorhizobium sp. SCN 65-20]
MCQAMAWLEVTGLPSLASTSAAIVKRTKPGFDPADNPSNQKARVTGGFAVSGNRTRTYQGLAPFRRLLRSPHFVHQQPQRDIRSHRAIDREHMKNYFEEN